MNFCRCIVLVFVRVSMLPFTLSRVQSPDTRSALAILPMYDPVTPRLLASLLKISALQRGGTAESTTGPLHIVNLSRRRSFDPKMTLDPSDAG
jgi:hypothetical protein